MCEALCQLAWILVSSTSELSELAETYYLYDSSVIKKVLCNNIFVCCRNNFVTGACAEHGWSVVGKEHVETKLADDVVQELLLSVPYRRAKFEEIRDLLGGLERPLWQLPIVESVLWTLYFNLMKMDVPYVSAGWYERSKDLSTILKSMDLPLSCCRWMEMNMLKGYGQHVFNISEVALKFCRGNGNLGRRELDQIYDSFLSVAGRPRYSSLRWDEYLASGRWATTGSAGGLKQRWGVDGDVEERRMKKNMMVDWYSLSDIQRQLMAQKELRCGLAMKNEIGKARPVVSADPWSYVPMSWVMEKVKDWLKSIPGFFVYVEGDDLVKLLTSTAAILACRGDDIVVTLDSGRTLSFDFKEYDHQIPSWFVQRLWVDLTADMDKTNNELQVVDKVTELLGNVRLYWNDAGIEHSSPLEGSLASGIRLTTYAGTVVSLGLGNILRRTVDPWPTIKDLNVLFSRSKCYQRRGGEFLRNYFTPDGVSAYPCRSVVAILQHKPWLDAELGRAQAMAKARFVTQQRLGQSPPHYFPLHEQYGCPQLYGGLGIGSIGWDYCKVDIDEERVSGVPTRGRDAQLVEQGLPDDVYTLAVAMRRIQLVYGRQRTKIVGGGNLKQRCGFTTWREPIHYDKLRYEYWNQRLSAYEAMKMVSPTLAWFVSEHKKWGRRQALQVADSGPEKALASTLFLPKVCVRTPDIYPNKSPGSLREFYRIYHDELTETGLKVARMAS